MYRMTTNTLPAALPMMFGYVDNSRASLHLKLDEWLDLLDDGTGEFRIVASDDFVVDSIAQISVERR